MPLLTTPAGRFCYFNSPSSAGGNNPPTITSSNVGFNFIGTTNADPYTNFTATNASTYAWTLYQSATTSVGSRFNSIDTGSNAYATGSDNITSYAATIIDRWYRFVVVVYNVYGPVSYTTDTIENLYTAPPNEP